MLSKRAQLADQRIVEALHAGQIRRSRIQRHVYERDTRLDVDAARIALDRHHRRELGQLVEADSLTE